MQIYIFTRRAEHFPINLPVKKQRGLTDTKCIMKITLHILRPNKITIIIVLFCFGEHPTKKISFNLIIHRSKLDRNLLASHRKKGKTTPLASSSTPIEGKELSVQEESHRAKLVVYVIENFFSFFPCLVTVYRRMPGSQTN